MGQHNKRERFARPPAVAGRFYSGTEKQLKQEVEQLFAHAVAHAGHRVRALIVPHAGYVFSGGVAASAYNQLDRNSSYKRIFLIGSSHRVPIPGAADYTEGNYRTPMGTVRVDSELGKELATAHPGLFTANSHAHSGEHSLEVQLPFLQHLYGDNILLLPLVIGTYKASVCQDIAQALTPWFTEENLFVISTDFSHYPSYKDAIAVDALTKDAILSNNPNTLLQVLDENEHKNIPGLDTSLCGWTSVLTLMYLTGEQHTGESSKLSVSQKPSSDQLSPASQDSFEYLPIEYKNSGDNPQYGEKDQVVGYWAIAVTEKKAAAEKTADSNKTLFSHKAETLLEAIAKEAIRKAIEDKDLLKATRSSSGAVKPKPTTATNKPATTTNKPATATNESLLQDPKQYPPELHKPYGAFVTLKQQGCLRGCIGRIVSDIPLYLLVQEMARAAALYDNRFPPVSVEDLPHLTYEITVLSPLREIKSIDEIELGKHGIIIEAKGRSGVFLPQVATETGWTLEEFLGHCSRDKAGLGWDGWKKAHISIFHALNT